MGIKLLFNYKNLNQKLRQIKILQTLQGEYDKSLQECILLNKKEYEKERKELMKYKSLYLDLVGSIYSIMNTFPKE